MLRISFCSWFFLLRILLLVNGESCSTWHNGAFTNKVTLIVEAKCQMFATTMNPTSLNGQFVFSQDPSNDYLDKDEGVTKLNVDYSVTGLTQGDHGYHVHRYGDLSSPNGSATGMHFIGVTDQRPQSGPQEVGLLNGGTPVQSDSGEASGKYSDKVASMNGENSILGRGMIIHGTDARDPLIRASQCVIGLTATNSRFKMFDSPCVTQAICSVTPHGDGKTTTGTISIYVRGTGKTKSLFFEASILGLANGNYKIIAEKKGDISNNGKNTGGVFTGEGVSRIAGLIGGASFSMTSVNKWVSISFDDSVVGLNGPNSILGRTLIITNTARNKEYGMCVVGLRRDVNSYLPKAPSISTGAPQVIQASAILRGSSASLYGYIEMKRLDKDYDKGIGTRIRYHVTGLTSGQWYSITVHRYVGGLGGVYVGFNVTRPKVGNWSHLFKADTNGMARETFSDPHTKFNDYNSILGRSVVISRVSNGANMLHGVIGRLVEHSVKDYVAAPIVRAIVHFHKVIQTSGTYGWLIITERGSNRHYNISLTGLTRSTKYNLHIGQTGDLFSIYDKVPTMKSAISKTAFTGISITTKTNGKLDATGTITQAINGATSILGKLIILEHATTKANVAVGVLGIGEDNVVFKPTKINCDIACPQAPTPRPTYVKGQTPAPTTTGKGIKRMSVLFSWSFIVIVYVLSNNGLFF